MDSIDDSFVEMSNQAVYFVSGSANFCPKQKIIMSFKKVLFDIRHSFFFRIQLVDFINFRCRNTKPQTFADCVGDELPYGWEKVTNNTDNQYFINHNTRKCL